MQPWWNLKGFSSYIPADSLVLAGWREEVSSKGGNFTESAWASDSDVQKEELVVLSCKVLISVGGYDPISFQTTPWTLPPSDINR